MSEELQCSAKGCRETASRAILWNNSRLHTPERKKTWLACDGHLDHLRDFLALRDFLIGDVSIDDIPEDAGWVAIPSSSVHAGSNTSPWRSSSSSPVCSSPCGRRTAGTSASRRSTR